MKKTFLIFMVFIASFSFVYSQYSEEFVQNQLIVKLKKDKKLNESIFVSLNNLYKIKRAIPTGNRKENRTFVLEFHGNQDIIDLVEIYSKTGMFDYVEPNFVGKGGGQLGAVDLIPDDTFFSRQYGLYNDGTFTESSSIPDADIDMDQAWDIQQGSNDIIVAVLDAGVKLDHPEFAGRIWSNPNESENGSDSDGNGLVDDVNGWDFAYNDNSPIDDYGHGTNVAGIIGANGNNGIGYAGVDWNCKLLVCKILKIDNTGSYSWWTDAIYYAVDNGANVINMSVGGGSFSNLMLEAVEYAYDNNVTIVACMMNFNSSSPQYPAAYEHTIAVGSTDADDTRSDPFFWSNTSGSNYGNHIDVVAPGNYIFGLHYFSNTNYNSYWGGTSQATPLVTGLSALLLAKDPSFTPDDIKEILRLTAEDEVGDSSEDKEGFDIYYGAGRVNAFEALSFEYVNTDLVDDKPFDFVVSPNPIINSLNIEFFSTSSGINKEIKILNMKGQELQGFSRTGTSFKLDVSSLVKGVYLIECTVDEVVMVKSMIKL